MSVAFLKYLKEFALIFIAYSARDIGNKIFLELDYKEEFVFVYFYLTYKLTSINLTYNDVVGVQITFVENKKV